jgi:hypothetical protein
MTVARGAVLRSSTEQSALTWPFDVSDVFCRSLPCRSYSVAAWPIMGGLAVDAAIAWARDALEIKNTLCAADAELLERAFAQRLGELEGHNPRWPTMEQREKVQCK